jgi:hypothetical protein
MKSRLRNLLPKNLPDESAFWLCEFLNDLAMAADIRYYNKIQRYHRRQPARLVDPHRPWITRSANPFGENTAPDRPLSEGEDPF